jgi:hypothetical protein
MAVVVNAVSVSVTVAEAPVVDVGDGATGAETEPLEPETALPEAMLAVTRTLRATPVATGTVIVHVREAPAARTLFAKVGQVGVTVVPSGCTVAERYVEVKVAA